MTDRPSSVLRAAQRTILVAVAAIVLWFTFDRLDSSLDEALDSVRSASRPLLFTAGCLALAGMAAIALGWVVLLRHASQKSISTTQALAWYFIGEITKYVPGGIWAVVGRGELAGRQIGRRPAYQSVTQSLVFFFSVASLPTIFAVATFDGWAVPVRLGVGLATAAVLPATYFVFRLPTAVIGALALRYLLAWLMIGLTTVVVAAALDVKLGIVDACVITAAAWLAGFAVVFLPGGVGIREAVFIALAPSTVDPSEALAIALCSRLLFVAADMVGAALGLVFRTAGEADGASA